MKAMATSGTLHRMRLSHPNEFLPSSVFLLTPYNAKNMKDWSDCYHIKASAFFSIFGRDADDENLEAAENLLKVIAKTCHSRMIKGKPIGEVVTPKANQSTEQQTGSNQQTNGANNSTGNNQSKVNEPVEKDEITSIVQVKPEDLAEDIKKTIDATYLLLGFLHEIVKQANKISNVDRDKLDLHCMARHGGQVVSDLAMIDNQLPLSLLSDVLSHLQPSISATASLTKSSLSLSQLDDHTWDSLKSFNLSFKRDKFHGAIADFYWYYSPFSVERVKFLDLREEEFKGKQHLLECLHQCLVQVAGAAGDGGDHQQYHVLPLPCAKELVRARVQFQAAAQRPLTVKFEEPVLKISALYFDWKMETVVMNLIALESTRRTRPVTRYFQVLNELVADVGDVKVLKRFGILKGKWRKDELVVDFVKRVGGFASYPSMNPAMDHQIQKVKAHYDTMMSQFLVKHAPTIKLVSSVAAASLLVTAIFAVRRSRSASK